MEQAVPTDKVTPDGKEWKERLADYFQDTDHRPSPERVAVAMALSEQTTYISADTLWLSMRKQNIRVSRATVYKALLWLVEVGFVQKKMDKGQGHQTALYLIH